MMIKEGVGCAGETGQDRGGEVRDLVRAEKVHADFANKKSSLLDKRGDIFTRKLTEAEVLESSAKSLDLG